MYHGRSALLRYIRKKSQKLKILNISEDLFLKLAYIEILDSHQQSWNQTGIKPDVLVHSTKSLSNSFGQSIDIQLSTAIQIQNSE